MNDTIGSRAEEPPFFRSGYLFWTLFLTGASVLVVEIVGARMTSSYFGASFFVWSSLITVTLVAVAGDTGKGKYICRGTTGYSPMYDQCRLHDRGRHDHHSS